MTREELIDELYRADRDLATSVTRSPIRNQTDSSCDKVIWLLRNNSDYMTPTELCHGLRVTTPRVTIILNSMENKGYITRDMSENDRRKIRVRLTAKGIEYDNDHEAQAKEFLNRMYDELGEENLIQVAKYLRTTEKIGSR